MNYLIFYLQFHKKVTEVALCGVCFAASGTSVRFKIRREYKKGDEAVPLKASYYFPAHPQFRERF